VFMTVRPKARFKNLVVEQRDDGAVIHDTVTGQSHRFDWVTTKVWSLADGQRTVSEIAEIAEIGNEEAAGALEQLGIQGLLADSGLQDGDGHGDSSRLRVNGRSRVARRGGDVAGPSTRRRS
jgi:hypothetical protein